MIAAREVDDLAQVALKPRRTERRGSVVERLLAKAAEENISLAFLLLRMDRFDEIVALNGYAHQFVEGLLRILLEQTPDGVFVDCTDANEFLVILPTADKQQVKLAGDEIRKCFSALASTLMGDSHIRVSLSGGAAVFPRDADNQVDLFRSLREAALSAGLSGGDRIVFGKKEKMVLKTVHYTPAQMERLKRLAAHEGISEASLLREALDDCLNKYSK